MLNINSLNFFNKNNNYRKTANIQSNQYSSGVQNVYKNLAPLAKDTVSFTGTRKSANPQPQQTEYYIDSRALSNAIHNEQACEAVHKRALVVEKKVVDALTPYFRNLVMTPQDRTNKPIFKIESRTKSPSSIKEKIIGRYVSDNGHATKANDSLDCLFDNDYITKKIGDLVGCRFVLGNHGQKETAKVIQGLIRAVNDGVLDIDKIEHFVSSELDSNWKYFRDEDLDALKNAVNAKRKKAGKPPIKVTTREKERGYMALHIDLDLSKFEGKAKEKGCRGEIQIVGYDVAKLKDVDDLPYKLLNRNENGEAIKQIKNGHYAYKPFETHFYRCLDDPNFDPENIKEAFKIYTKKAYQKQRTKAASTSLRRENRNYKYPTIEECGLKGALPEGLDFNVLAKIKEGCDQVYNNVGDAA